MIEEKFTKLTSEIKNEYESLNQPTLNFLNQAYESFQKELSRLPDFEMNQHKNLITSLNNYWDKQDKFSKLTQEYIHKMELVDRDQRENIIFTFFKDQIDNFPNLKSIKKLN